MAGDPGPENQQEHRFCALQLCSSKRHVEVLIPNTGEGDLYFGNKVVVDVIKLKM